MKEIKTEKEILELFLSDIESQEIVPIEMDEGCAGPKIAEWIRQRISHEQMSWLKDAYHDFVASPHHDETRDYIMTEAEPAYLNEDEDMEPDHWEINFIAEAGSVIRDAADEGLETDNLAIPDDIFTRWFICGIDEWD